MDPRLVAADDAIKQGRISQAVDLMVGALNDGCERSLSLYRVLLRNLLTLKRFSDGAFWAEKAVEFEPRNYELLNLYGIFLRRSGRHRDALPVLDQAIKLQPNDPVAQVNKGNILNDMADGPAAEAIFTKLVRRNPKSAEYQRALARALLHQKKHGPAAMRLRQAISLKKDDVDAWLDLAAMASSRTEKAEALATLDRALKAVPDDQRLLQAKAGTMRLFSDHRGAEAFLLTLMPKFGHAAWLHNQIAKTVAGFDREKANIHHRKAVDLEPANFEYRMALAESMERTRGPAEGTNIDEGYAVLKGSTFPERPGSSEAKIAMEIFKRVADYDAIFQLGSFQDLGRSWALTGNHTALLGQMPRVKSAEDRVELLHQHRLWGDTAIERAQLAPITFPRDPKPTSKIRIGFMSSDLRDHPVAYFALPLFENIDRDQFEIYCYSFYQGAAAGPIQQKLTGLVDAFRWHPDISDRDAAQMIANDQLDMLFELGGATHMNKIDVMAWKPARITASWLGYPHSIGLSTIDYLMVDPHLCPPDRSLLIEQPLIMPRSWIAMSDYAFPEGHVINPVAPVRRNGFITFGTANNPYKYGPEMLRVWARTVAAVPNSRFLFVRPEGGSQAFVRNIRARFEAEGISADRVQFSAVRGAHMPHYNDIDIALDTFPQTGGTTTCEAAWMGVPTVTLVGQALFERLSYSILQNAGLGDLCAETSEQFEDIATCLAADHDRLQALRTGLRAQIKASPLGQTQQFAKDFYDLVARTVGSELGAQAAEGMMSLS